MRASLLILVFLLSAVPFAAQTPAPTNTVEESILKLTNEWLSAEERHDRATLQRIIADDFQGTAPFGNTVVKGDVVPAEGAQSGGLAIATSNIKARVFGETAVVTGNGVPKQGPKRDLRFTVVFVRRNNVWQMVAGHLSAVPTE